MSARRPRPRWVGAVLPPALLAAVVVGVWYFVSYAVLAPRRRFLLPPPQQVVTDGFGDSARMSEIGHATWATAQVALVGLGLSILLGVATAVVMSQARPLEASIYPWAVVLQTLPILAVVPLIGFWFSFGFNSRVIICVLVSIFPIITNTLFGLKSIDRGQRELFRLHRVGRLRTLYRLQAPAALPAMLAGLRISAGASVIGAIVGDFFFRQGNPGLGRLIDNYTSSLESPPLFAAIIVSSALSLVLFWAVGLVSRVTVAAWHETGGRRD